MSSISLSSIDIVDRFPSSKLSVNNLDRYSQFSLSQCERTWAYVSRTSVFTRHLLNAIIRSPCIIKRFPDDYPPKVGNIATHFRLFSAVGLPLGLISLYGASEKFWKNLESKDSEGVALSALSLSIEGADFFDSITTVVNASLALIALPAVALYSAIGLPIGCTIAGLGTISRTIRIAKACKLYQGIGRHLQLHAPMRSFLEKNYGVSHNEIFFNAKSHAALLRATSPTVIAALEKALLPNSVETTAKLQAARSQLRKEICLSALGVLANMVVLTGLILFVLAVATALPFVLLATGFAIRIAALIYQDNYL